MDWVHGFFTLLKEGGYIRTDKTCNVKDKEDVLITQGLLCMTCTDGEMFRLTDGLKLDWYVLVNFTYTDQDGLDALCSFRVRHCIRTRTRPGMYDTFVELNIPPKCKVSKTMRDQKMWLTCGRERFELAKPNAYCLLLEKSPGTNSTTNRKVGPWQARLCGMSYGNYDTVDDLASLTIPATSMFRGDCGHARFSQRIDMDNKLIVTLHAIEERMAPWTSVPKSFKDHFSAIVQREGHKVEERIVRVREMQAEVDTMVTESEELLGKRKRRIEAVHALM
jgi:hypothetical protein